ncbi:MAG: PBP1A family penicillin-binding protein [Syntrophomonadaceae bacterium]|nr:PBP1A family penicillin-binding protein [Syntrophomonadaceae bacterium]
MKKVLLFLLCGAGLLVLYGFFWDLPQTEVRKPSMVYDVNTRPISGLTSENKIYVPLNEIAPDFINAIIAVEDKNFYKHWGIDWRGVARALYNDIKAGNLREGGSTITQQTAKSLFLNHERTWIRKLKEFYYAVQLERKYSKDEILTLYCNTIFFGHGAYGVEVASRTYFGTTASELTLAQAALLAGLPQSPSAYNPYVNPDKAKERQKMVLERMAADGFIDEALREKAMDETLNYTQAHSASGDAPYFIAMVKNYLIEKYGERMVYQGGLQVFTTLDLEMQKAANKAYLKGLQNVDENLQAALVAVDISNGHVRALIGGRNYIDSNYNRAFSKRQPGSTFKPFVYSLAVDSGMTEADMLMCEEIEYTLPDGKKYTPADYGEKPFHWKRFTLKEALMISDNSIAVQINNILTPELTAEYSEKFGFKNIQPVLSLPLGASEVSPMELTGAYACFANQGVYHEPAYILKVTDQNGEIMENTADVKGTRVVSGETAYIVTNMLSGVLHPGGTASHLRPVLQSPAAGKTGTTDSHNDAWFVGYTSRVCAAVWVGYDQAKSTNFTGGGIAGPIWADFMQASYAQAPAGNFIKPPGIDSMNICLDSGMVASDKCKRTSEMAFKKGSAPPGICYHQFLGLFDNFPQWLDEPPEGNDN